MKDQKSSTPAKSYFEREQEMSERYISEHSTKKKYFIHCCFRNEVISFQPIDNNFIKRVDGLIFPRVYETFEEYQKLYSKPIFNFSDDSIKTDLIIEVLIPEGRVIYDCNKKYYGLVPSKNYPTKVEDVVRIYDCSKRQWVENPAIVNNDAKKIENNDNKLWSCTIS